MVSMYGLPASGATASAGRRTASWPSPRTYVKSVDVGVFSQVRRAFQVTRCNQREDAPCVAACPTQATFRREDGIVDF
jgi:Fe-S-cluster-containing dehydrogenase component